MSCIPNVFHDFKDCELVDGPYGVYSVRCACGTLHHIDANARWFQDLVNIWIARVVEANGEEPSDSGGVVPEEEQLAVVEAIEWMTREARPQTIEDYIRLHIARTYLQNEELL